MIKVPFQPRAIITGAIPSVKSASDRFAIPRMRDGLLIDSEDFAAAFYFL
jgi:hypothetical protein